MLKCIHVDVKPLEKGTLRVIAKHEIVAFSRERVYVGLKDSYMYGNVIG